MTDDAIDRYLERIAREEEDDINRKHGQHILDMLKGDKGRRRGDALLQAIARAHLAKAKEADADK